MNSLLQFFRDSILGSSLDAMPPDLCATRHPIILLHGIAFRDDMIFSSWGHVPEFLEKGGANVYLGGLDAWNSIVGNAGLLKIKVEEILAQNGAKKVNLIAHSKGGLDSRYMISRLGMGDKVASLTTVSTPHRGSAFADVATKLLPDEHGLAYGAVDLLGKLMGDKGSQSALAIAELTRANMEKFNAETPDAEGIHYQSFGTRMTSLFDDPLFVPSYEVVKKYEGENDGMVSVASYQWGNFRGVLEGHGGGISHLQITGAVRDVVSGINIPMWYIGMAQDLKAQGY
jgi:triacylglycerol lipase